MKFRPEDENGDMIPMRIPSQLLEDTDAVAAAIKSRLELIKGDWWEDEEVGFEIPVSLIRGVRGDDGCRVLVGYMLAYVLKTEGVTKISYYDYKREKRTLSANIRVNTIYGEDVEGSVDLNELFSAQIG